MRSLVFSLLVFMKNIVQIDSGSLNPAGRKFFNLHFHLTEQLSETAMFETFQWDFGTV